VQADTHEKNIRHPQSGIATFTTDLRCAIATRFPAIQCQVVPVNDIEEGYDYPSEGRFEIAEQDLSS
jgi:hypothetical protein